MNSKITQSAIVGGWVLALVTGCSSIPSVGPNYEEPQIEPGSVVLPDAGSPTTNLTASCEYKPAKSSDDSRVIVSKNVIEQWWKRFNDPVLDRLVEGGISNNFGFLRAQAKLTQSNYELLGSYAAFLPKFTVGGDWYRNWKNKHVTGNGNGQNGYNYNLKSVGLDGNWEIDIFGGNRRASEAAFAKAEAAGWTVADAWVSLTSQIGVQYVNLRTTQERIEVARTNLVLQSETYDILKSRLDSGIGDELAVNQCAYIVEKTRASIPSLLATEEVIKNALTILAGEMPGSLEDYLKPVPVRRDWLLAPQKVGELSLDMMRARPDVKAAERALAAQVAYVGVAKAQWFPKLFVSGSVGMEAKNGQRLFSRDSFFALLGPSVSWPIFQGGAIYANVKATEAQVEQAVLDYEEAIQGAYAEVRNEFAAYSQEYHRYQALGYAVKAASDAVTISKDLYKNGLKDFNNVIDAQRSRLEYEEQFVISRGAITTNLIKLYRALGGGLEYEDSDENEDRDFTSTVRSFIDPVGKKQQPTIPGQEKK